MRSIAADIDRVPRVLLALRDGHPCWAGLPSRGFVRPRSFFFFFLVACDSFHLILRGAIFSSPPVSFFCGWNLHGGDWLSGQRCVQASAYFFAQWLRHMALPVVIVSGKKCGLIFEAFRKRESKKISRALKNFRSPGE